MSNITADEYSLLEFISSRDKQEDNSRILLEQTKKILKSLVQKGFGRIEHYSAIGDWFIPDMGAISEFVETHVGQYKLERKYLQYDMFNILEEISRKGYGWDYVSQSTAKASMERLRHYGCVTYVKRGDRYIATGTPEGIAFAKNMMATATRTCAECGRKYPYYSGMKAYDICSKECYYKRFGTPEERRAKRLQKKD